MKIMIFNTLYAPYRIGGAEVSVQLLAEELVKQGHEVRVVTLNREKERKQVLLNGVTVVYLPLKNVLWPYANLSFSKFKKILWHILDIYNPLMYRQSCCEIDEFKPDVVHTNNISGFSVSVWNAVKKKKIKLIHTTRDYYLFHPNSTLFTGGEVMDPKSLTIKLWSFVKKIMSNKVDHYVGISSYIKELHINNGFFSNAQEKVIFNSVSVVKQNHVSSDKIRIGFLGRLSVEKGYDEFCRLANKFKDDKRYSFIAAGVMVNNTDKVLLERMTIESNVDVKGYMALEDFLGQVDVVVLPIKWNEPFGRTIVECALSKKIVLTSPVGAMPELASILDNVNVTSDFIGSFEEIIGSVNADCITEDVCKIFSPKTIAVNYVDVYSEKIGDQVIMN